jgi:GDSL-like Lipase/Acylhydrolase family
LGVSNFRDPSCSGAETEDMTMPQGVSPGPNPPQFDSLAADTQLVTLGIGGNEIGFSKIAAVLDGIHRRSPKARIFVVGYLAILPESGPGCWPQMPIAPDDVPYVRETEKKLNAMLSAQAAANRAKYVDAYAASVGHDACQLPGFRWVEPAVPTTPAAPVHPNLFGMQGYAAAVLARINERG